MAGATRIDQLQRLEGKYRLLGSLRARRDQVKASGLGMFSGEESVARLRLFRQVAMEFPGSLRELENSTAAQLEERRRSVEMEIQALRERGGAAELSRPWIAVVLEYHALLREALAIKKWLAANLAKDAGIDAGVLKAFRSWHRRCAHRHTPPGSMSEKLLARYRTPPDGRITSLVWERLVGIFEMERPDLERMVFSPPAERS